MSEGKQREYAQLLKFMEDEAFNLAKFARACKRGRAELQKLEENIDALPEGDSKRKKLETKKATCLKTLDKEWANVVTLVGAIQSKYEQILKLSKS